MGTRELAAGLDFSEFLEEEVESQLKEVRSQCSSTWDTRWFQGIFHAILQ